MKNIFVKDIQTLFIPETKNYSSSNYKSLAFFLPLTPLIIYDRSMELGSHGENIWRDFSISHELLHWTHVNRIAPLQIQLWNFMLSFYLILARLTKGKGYSQSNKLLLLSALDISPLIDCELTKGGPITFELKKPGFDFILEGLAIAQQLGNEKYSPIKEEIRNILQHKDNSIYSAGSSTMINFFLKILESSNVEYKDKIQNCIVNKNTIIEDLFNSSILLRTQEAFPSLELSNIIISISNTIQKERELSSDYIQKAFLQLFQWTYSFEKTSLRAVTDQIVISPYLTNGVKKVLDNRNIAHNCWKDIFYYLYDLLCHIERQIPKSLISGGPKISGSFPFFSNIAENLLNSFENELISNIPIIVNDSENSYIIEVFPKELHESLILLDIHSEFWLFFACTRELWRWLLKKEYLICPFFRIGLHCSFRDNFKQNEDNCLEKDRLIRSDIKNKTCIFWQTLWAILNSFNIELIE